LALKESLRIGIEVCEALEAAQRAGIVHRDLKPGNIMLTKNGAKLMDFGLAKAALSGLASASSAPLLSAAKTMSEATPLSQLTSAGMVIGTIQYMSPEQIEGKEADARSDLFALGAVLDASECRLVGFLLRLVLMHTCTMSRVQRDYRSIWNRTGSFSIVFIPSGFEQSLPICKM
jgi:serine/threonine protein kinase